MVVYKLLILLIYVSCHAQETDGSDSDPANSNGSDSPKSKLIITTQDTCHVSKYTELNFPDTELASSTEFYFEIKSSTEPRIVFCNEDAVGILNPYLEATKSDTPEVVDNNDITSLHDCLYLKLSSRIYNNDNYQSTGFYRIATAGSEYFEAPLDHYNTPINVIEQDLNKITFFDSETPVRYKFITNHPHGVIRIELDRSGLNEIVTPIDEGAAIWFIEVNLRRWLGSKQIFESSFGSVGVCSKVAGATGG